MSWAPVPRGDWGSRTDWSGRPRVQLPVPRVFIHHSVTLWEDAMDRYRSPTEDAFDDMREVENIGIERFGLHSYSYNVHPREGIVMEGAGDFVGAHTGSANSTSLAVCAIGNYDTDTVTGSLLDGFVACVGWLIDTGRATRDAALLPHSDVFPTACPGANLRPRIASIHQRVLSGERGLEGWSPGAWLAALIWWRLLIDRIAKGQEMAKIVQKKGSTAQFAIIPDVGVVHLDNATESGEVAKGWDAKTTQVSPRLFDALYALRVA